MCPAKTATCKYCNEVRHYAKVCRKRLMKLRYNRDHTSNAIGGTTLAPISASAVQNLNRVFVNIVTTSGNILCFKSIVSRSQSVI